MSFDEIIFSFKRYISLEKGLSENTAISYVRDVKLYLKFCIENGISPLNIDSSDLDNYLWHLKTVYKLKSASIFRKAESIKAFYKFLTIDGKISRNHLSRFKSPKLEKKLPQTLSIPEIEKLLDNYKDDKFNLIRTLAIIELFYATGIRVSELINLRLESINIENGWIRVIGKGTKERIVPVHKNAIKVISKYLEYRNKHFENKQASSELFLNKFGKKLSRIQVWKDIKKWAKEAGIEKNIYPHLLRHSFATHLLSGGADLRSIGEMLGHSSLNTTQIYTHLNNSELKNIHKKYHPEG